MSQPPQTQTKKRDNATIILGSNWLEDQIRRIKHRDQNITEINESIRQLFRQTGGNWYGIGSVLQKILIERLYRAGGYTSFSDYCQHVLGYSRQHAYKLIKVSEFINRHWASAHNDAQKQLVYRLFNLGLTKIYILLSISDESVIKMLQDGVQISLNNGQTKLRSLEEISIIALKQILNQNLLHKRRVPYQSKVYSNTDLADLLNLQMKSLRWLMEAYRQDLANGADNSETKLKTIEQHIEILSQGLSLLISPQRALTHNEYTGAVVVTDHIEHYITVQQALAQVGILTIQAKTLQAAQQFYNGTTELMIMPVNSIESSQLPQKAVTE